MAEETEQQRQWLQQQLTKVLGWDASMVESIAEGLVNATDDNHVVTIFKVRTTIGYIAHTHHHP